MGVIMSKEFHRALDVDGSMKGKAWDFVMKLGREADLTGLDLKKPRVRLFHRYDISVVG
jgi:hypothetical protein